MINRVEQVSTSNDFYDFITQKFSDGVNLVESVSNDLTKEIEEETGYLIGGSQYFDLEKNESVAVFSMQKNIDREHSHWVNPKYDKVVRISSSPYSDRKENIEHKSIESAKDAYDRAIQNDWLVVRADIPKMLKFGWLEVRGSGTTHHCISARNLKGLQRKAPDSIGKTLEEYNRMFPDAVYPEEFTTTKKDGTVVNVLETVSKVAEVIAITHAKSIEK
jgi:hypothetical protein